MASRRSLRETSMICLYQYLLLKSDVRIILEDLCACDLKDIDPFILDAVIECLENKEAYVAIIEKHLKNWEYSRLGYIEQAILLLATHEIDSGKTDKAVAINEAIELAKKYCDDESYKFINGVLDNL